MAYADGELAGPERSAVERAMHEDPAVAEAIARHRQLRGDVFAAFADVLDEPVPVPLRQAVQPKVAGLEAARVARSGQGTRAQGDWWRWGGMAASLVVGILVGIGGWQAYRQDGGTASLVAAAGGVLAQGKLADALSRELAGSPAADASVRIGVTFQARDGNYCRSFALAGAAGLACREGDAWRVAVLQQQAPAAQPAYRQAGVAMPPAVLEAIDERIAGTALDAAGERAARERGWRR
ncbi:anti-sigma factor [Pseudoduganella plicata]|nr:anti-sigma factor [Pseudoduganella plicata]